MILIMKSGCKLLNPASVVKQDKEMWHKSERKRKHYHTLQMILENPRESTKIY